jgi:hypothetical protein
MPPLALTAFVFFVPVACLMVVSFLLSTVITVPPDFVTVIADVAVAVAPALSLTVTVIV